MKLIAGARQVGGLQSRKLVGQTAGELSKLPALPGLQGRSLRPCNPGKPEDPFDSIPATLEKNGPLHGREDPLSYAVAVCDSCQELRAEGLHQSCNAMPKK